MERTGWCAQRSSTISLSDPVSVGLSPLSNCRSSSCLENKWQCWEGWVCNRVSIWICRSISLWHLLRGFHIRRWILRRKRAPVIRCPHWWSRAGNWLPFQDPSRGVGDPDSGQCQGPCSLIRVEQGAELLPHGQLRLLWDSFVLQNKSVPWFKRKCWSQLSLLFVGNKPPIHSAEGLFLWASEKSLLLGDWKWKCGTVRPRAVSAMVLTFLETSPPFLTETCSG